MSTSIRIIKYTCGYLCSLRRNSSKCSVNSDVWQTLRGLNLAVGFTRRGRRAGVARKRFIPHLLSSVRGNEQCGFLTQAKGGSIICSSNSSCHIDSPPSLIDSSLDVNLNTLYKPVMYDDNQTQPDQGFQQSTPGNDKFNLPTLIVSNVRSLISKVDELDMVSSHNNADIICISESWLNSCIADSSVSLPNRILFRSDRTSARGGGVCIYVSQSIPCRRINAFEQADVESLWVSVRPHRLPREVSVILVSVIYNSTSSNADYNTKLYQHIQINVDKFLRDHPEALVLITGDFNPNSTGFSEKQIKAMTGLKQIITVKTRDTGILDWCLTNKPKLFDKPLQLPKIGQSDHYTVLIKPVFPSLNIKSNRSMYKRDMRESKIRTLGQWITEQNWSEVTTMKNCEDKYAEFYKILRDAIDKFLPVISTKLTSSDKPWITTKLKQLINRRQKAFFKYGKDSPSYKQLRNLVQKECSLAKENYYSKKVTDLKSTNLSRWWKEIKNLGGLTSKDEWHHQLLNEEMPSCQLLAEKYNNFLTSLTADFTPLSVGNTAGNTSSDVPHQFRVTVKQAQNALESVKINKAVGADGIPNRVLKEFAPELAPIIAHIYNSSLTQGIVPSALKMSIIRPIPKCQPPKSIEDDLRPIALTSQIAKVMEGFTLKSLYAQVRSKIDPKQFALNKKSTSHALLYFMHNILQPMDKGNCSVRIFFADFRKGFDLVDHNVLINELYNLGVHSSIIQWIRSFLTQRTQAVKVDQTVSSWSTLNGGIPQGTKLGPLLFAILVNSLLEDWPARLKFVDDTTAIEVIPRCSPSLMPLVVRQIDDFATERGMRLNPKKCKEMIIDFLQYRLPINSPMYIGKVSIEKVESYKLLGLHITADLTWNVHVEYILKKANSRLYVIRLLRKANVSPTDLVAIYCSIVRSVLEYAATVWSNLPRYLSDQLESIQKRALRSIYPNFTYQQALDVSGLDRLDVRREKICVNLAEKLKQSKDPFNPLTPLLNPPNQIEHAYNLRSNRSLRPTILPKTDRFKNFFTHKYI